MKFCSLPLMVFWLATPALTAEENRTYLVTSFDLLNRQILSTKTKSDQDSSSVTSKDMKSTKPGAWQLALFSKGWGLLANITPDTASSGLVGAGYETWAGQYLGLAYNINTVEYSDATPSVRQEFFGFLGYHILGLGEGQRMTALWTMGPTFSESPQKSSDGTQVTGRGQGSSLSLTLRYLYKITDNLSLSPALKGGLQSTRIRYAGTSLKRDVTRLEFVPIALQLRI